MNDEEHRIQCAFIEIIRLNQNKYPELKKLHAIGNGGKRPGKISKSGVYYSPVAVKMKREGVIKGVWDIFLPIPKGGWCGFYMEFKSEKGCLSKEQKEFREGLELYHKFDVFKDSLKAWESVKEYLNIR